MELTPIVKSESLQIPQAVIQHLLTYKVILCLYTGQRAISFNKNKFFYRKTNLCNIICGRQRNMFAQDSIKAKLTFTKINEK